jgi:hypothetical protein
MISFACGSAPARDKAPWRAQARSCKSGATKKPAFAGFFVPSVASYFAAAGAAAASEAAGAEAASEAAGAAAAGAEAGASAAGAAAGAAAFSPQADRDRANRTAIRAERFILFNFLIINSVAK